MISRQLQFFRKAIITFWQFVADFAVCLIYNESTRGKRFQRNLDSYTQCCNGGPKLDVSQSFDFCLILES